MGEGVVVGVGSGLGVPLGRGFLAGGTGIGTSVGVGVGVGELVGAGVGLGKLGGSVGIWLGLGVDLVGVVGVGVGVDLGKMGGMVGVELGCDRGGKVGVGVGDPIGFVNPGEVILWAISLLAAASSGSASNLAPFAQLPHSGIATLDAIGMKNTPKSVKIRAGNKLNLDIDAKLWEILIGRRFGNICL